MDAGKELRCVAEVRKASCLSELHTNQLPSGKLFLIAAPWWFPSTSALISPMFPLWLSVPPNPGKILTVYQTSIREKVQSSCLAIKHEECCFKLFFKCKGIGLNL
jgi:hypothetical protein